ncbi:MAG TPA: ABC transporter substrate-binding protein, partial [Agromyces sp.]
MKHSTRRGLAAGAFAVTAALILAACSSGDSGGSGGGSAAGELTPVKLQLQWFTQAQFAGYYVA